MTTFIPVSEPVIGAREKELVMECLNTGWISSEGPFVSQFEEAFSRLVGRNHGIACANGSAALDIAVAALKLGPGDEVILPAFTIISCANAIVRSGATPVLVDADPYTWTMVPEQVAAAVTSRTAAIMVVHIYGLPVDLDPILELAERHGLAVIEDAAELIGGTYKGRPCGSFGTISTFSFYPNKHITTGEGGMVLTNDPALAERCRSLRNLCFQPEQRFVHTEIGWNYRMTNMQAALGLAQLERLDWHLQQKLRIGRVYTEAFEKAEPIQLPCFNAGYAHNIFWVYGVLLNSGTLEFSRLLASHLRSIGIGSRPFFWPIHLQPVFLEAGYFSGVSHPVSECLGRSGIYFPSSPSLSDAQLVMISQKVIEFLSIPRYGF